MKNVIFDESAKAFEYEQNGSLNSIDFNPVVDIDDYDIDYNDYVVELLINPILDRELCMYRLTVKEGVKKKDVGAVFSINALNSSEDIPKKLSIYLFVAFKVCLERLSSLSDPDDISKSFEPNVSVCVFNKKLCGFDNPLHLCIHSLREYGYSYFESDNHFVIPDGYQSDRILRDKQVALYVDFSIPKLYENSIVDTIMRHLPYADNVAYRFILLYQIIELLMEDASFHIVRDYSNMYLNDKISRNDFKDAIKGIDTERDKIAEMFITCKVHPDHSCKFCNAARDLFKICDYTPNRSSTLSDAFYTFRNLLTHSYRKVHPYPNELSLAVQYFELVVLDIVKTYPNNVE